MFEIINYLPSRWLPEEFKQKSTTSYEVFQIEYLEIILYVLFI